MHIPELALDGVVGGPHRHAGADADLTIGPVERRLGDILPPVGQFAEGIGNDLHGASLEGQIELMAGGKPLADDVVFVWQKCPELQPLPGGGRLRRILPGIAGAGMLIPGHGIAHQRLAEPVVVQTRPPFGLRKEWIDTHTRQQPGFAVVGGAAQVEPGALLVALFPLRLIIFLEEVHIADPASGSPRLPAATNILAVAPERTAAEGAGVGEIAALPTEVVDPAVVDDPGVEHAVGGRADAEKIGPVVEQRCAAADAALAQVVDIEIPIDTIRRPPPAENLKGVPARQHLRAKDAIVLELCIVDIEGRLLGIGGEHRPPQHRHPGERDGVVATGDHLLVLDERLTRGGIGQRLAKGTGQRHLFVGELQCA